MSSKIISKISPFLLNKDENVYRYAVRGGKYRERDREMER